MRIRLKVRAGSTDVVAASIVPTDVADESRMSNRRRGVDRVQAAAHGLRFAFDDVDTVNRHRIGVSNFKSTTRGGEAFLYRETRDFDGV